MLDIDVIINHAAFKRAGAVKSGGGNNVVERVGLHSAKQVADATGFHLENTLGFATLQQRVRGFVVQRQSLKVQVLAGCLFDQSDGARQDG